MAPLRVELNATWPSGDTAGAFSLPSPGFKRLKIARERSAVHTRAVWIDPKKLPLKTVAPPLVTSTRLPSGDSWTPLLP